MVDLLWRDGNLDAALRLEEIWNEMADEFRFSLLCAYDLSTFGSSSHSDAFGAICNRHTHVRPSEQYLQRDDEARLLEISLLQQRARALEAEVERRKELEQRLMTAASEQLALLERERAARADAEAANRAKSDFLAVMSHELRTPLNAIGGHVQLLEMGLHGPVTEAQHAALGRIVNNQRHLLSLINDVLNLSRVERGRVEIVATEVPLGALVTEIAATLQPMLITAGLSLEVVTHEDALVVRADRDKVAQILLNVLHNAIKFTPEGGSITASLRYSLFREEFAEIRVRDTGVGIEPSKLSTIFEPFVQLDRRRTTRHEGIGLGLTISRDLARAMGGELTAESEAGAGATFVLSLPLA
jgi:signal transduction histidine kinase